MFQLRMRTTNPWHFNPERPKLSLVIYYVVWKLLLLLTALASPSPAYDTSTSLALGAPMINHESIFRLPSIIDKLTRWDAIYFTQISHTGYVFEQQWMAGYGFVKLLGFFDGLKTPLLPLAQTAVVGIIGSHISHLLSVLLLHELSVLALGCFPQPKRSSMALLAACLHIISPAGLFLSAPYAESLFSLMTFSGFYLYGKSLLYQGERGISGGTLLVSSGLCLGLASTIRANGILNGLLFVYEVVSYAHSFVFWKDSNPKFSTKRLSEVLFAGIMMGCIAVFPQLLAYLEYCTPLARRPWCSFWLPSIYAWVQSEYWGVGFLNYWTIDNIPLFILAFPILSIMCISGHWTWTNTAHPSNPYQITVKEDTLKETRSVNEGPRSNLAEQNQILRRLAIPQIALAILALTTYHVQIITRLSSGYPVWYWWVAFIITEDRGPIVILRRKVKLGALITRWMVIYAIVQGGLFASFLPPA